MTQHDLPMVGVPTERADAARNRKRILEAADRLFTRDGVTRTSMDAIAAEAGVGKGTLFRRFGDRASLALALMEDSDRAFQEAFIRGPAPLGPGAPPCERLVAFGRGLLAQVAKYGDLIVTAQTARAPGSRFDIDPSGAYRAHITLLIRTAAPELDASYTAEALLAALSADVVMYQIRQRGLTVEHIGAGWEEIVRRVLSGAGAGNDC
jgi:AcrR family transcriptional regulator